jgi:NAD(P)H-hydrate epimerase
MTLPAWADPLYTAGEMRAVDAWAIERAGVPSDELMERAGEGLARVVARVAGRGPVRIVVGRGNNGGDGLVAARLLRAEGREVDVLAAAELDGMEGDARLNLERLPGRPPAPWAPEALDGSGVVVDCLLGTGFSGAPREPVASVIAAMNAQRAPVVACDVPSGVDASSGEVVSEAVRARVTATFHGSKVGLWVAPGALCAGEVEEVGIGVPRGAPDPSEVGLIAARVLELVPSRPRHGTKFTSGVVTIVGGGRGLTGAPAMAAMSAMRAGAGYVQVAVPASIEPALELRLLEAMTRGLPEEEGGHVPDGVAGVVELAERAGAVVLGPGLGRRPASQDFARGVAQAVEAPLLVDADGLNAHAGRLEDLRERTAPTVLTPHAGELGRLLDVPSDEVDAHRLERAREAAARSGAIVVLKGDDTIVAAPEGPVVVSTGASPALATAGTGDVLSGLVATLLAKGLEPFEAAAAGVLAHARAGRNAAERHGADHVIASDVIDALPAAFRR